MALTSSSGGGIHPGSGALTVFRYTSTNNEDMYTVPNGRILYVTDGQMLKIKGESAGLPTDHRGGLTTDYNHAPFYLTAGKTLRSSGTGAIFIGVEIDA